MARPVWFAFIPLALVMATEYGSVIALSFPKAPTKISLEPAKALTKNSIRRTPPAVQQRDQTMTASIAGLEKYENLRTSKLDREILDDLFSQPPKVIAKRLAKVSTTLLYAKRNLKCIRSPAMETEDQKFSRGDDFPISEERGKKWIERSWMLSIVLMLLSATVAIPPALADTTKTIVASVDYDVKILNHQYADPRHPQCRRTIRVDKDGKTFHYSGTATGKREDPVAHGCFPEEIKEFGFRAESKDGLILSGLVLSADDGVFEGQWEPAQTANDFDGIRWKDGNKWIVADEPKTLSKAIGEWIFLAYIGFSTLAGVKGVADKIREKSSRESL